MISYTDLDEVWGQVSTMPDFIFQTLYEDIKAEGRIFSGFRFPRDKLVCATMTL